MFPGPQIVELLALAGFHFVQIDGEHGPFGPEDIEQTCLAAEAFGLTVIARTPSINVDVINLYVDRGVQGIMGPHVDSTEDACRLTKACRFAPEGERSWGGGRALHYNDPASVEGDSGDRVGILRRANSEMIVIAQLETKAAMDGIEDLLTVPGIDYFAFGPNDLAQSMGLPGQPDDLSVQAIMEETVKRVHGAGRKMVSDDMSLANAPGLLLNGARDFIRRTTQ
jgi:4-hydroxy-2-oxoheptanedioate aldolase